MRTLKYGGDLHPGDFIAISDGNRISFGWYFGDGINRTLQYYYLYAPNHAYDHYKQWSAMSDDVKASSWYNKKYGKGFTIKCLYKGYINAVHDTRIMKITNPEDIFTTLEDREIYEKSREVLIKLNFVKP
jgi:hypothetical protein